MAGSIPGSDIAERAPAIARRAAPAPAPEQRWVVLRRAARTRLAPFGAAVLLAAVLVALGAPLLAPYDPLEQNLGQALSRPGRAHLLGTDNIGRDVMSRVIWGTRVSLVAGFASVAVAAVTGSLLGVLAGYAGGRADGLVMRAMDAVLSFPPLVLALALGAVLGAGLGIQPPGASWGSMINAGRGYLQQAPWIVFGPGAALFVTVVGLNFVGDAIRDALDPRL